MIHKMMFKRVIEEGIKSLETLACNIPDDFESFIEYVMLCRGRVVLVGMGKSGHIAKKIAASLSSTGTPAFFMHPGEASHGDLGMITEHDVVLMLSNSGETQELFDTINYCRRFNIKIAGITMNQDSTLGKNSDFLLNIPNVNESSEVAAPTNSSLIMLSLGDAIVTCLHEAKGFTKDQYKNFHPGGKIGASLLKISDLMYIGEKLPIIRTDTNFYELIIKVTEKSLGCAIIVDDYHDKTDGHDKKILGVITDGDLRRHMNDEKLHELKAKDIMTKNPITIEKTKLASDALFIMNDKSITALPVAEKGKLVGIIHIHDILRAGVG